MQYSQCHWVTLNPTLSSSSCWLCRCWARSSGNCHWRPLLFQLPNELIDEAWRIWEARKLKLEHRWLKNILTQRIAQLLKHQFPAVFATRFLWIKFDYGGGGLEGLWTAFTVASPRMSRTRTLLTPSQNAGVNYLRPKRAGYISFIVRATIDVIWHGWFGTEMIIELMWIVKPSSVTS